MTTENEQRRLSMLGRIEHVLGLHGMPAGEDPAVWLARTLVDSRAHKLGIQVWDDYMKDVDAMMRSYGYAAGELRITWLKEQLENLARLRRGEPDGYKATDRNFRCAPDETSSAEPCSTN